jgi:hypothetical protein
MYIQPNFDFWQNEPKFPEAAPSDGRSKSRKRSGPRSEAGKSSGARSSLGTDEGPVLDPDLRLKKDIELVFRKCSPQLRIERAARLRAEHRLEVTTGAPAVGLCLIKGKIGICDQIIDASSVTGSDCNACAAAEMQRVIADVEGLRELLEHCVDHFADAARITAIRHDQHELIPAEAEHLSANRVLRHHSLSFANNH